MKISNRRFASDITDGRLRRYVWRTRPRSVTQPRARSGFVFPVLVRVTDDLCDLCLRLSRRTLTDRRDYDRLAKSSFTVVTNVVVFNNLAR